MHASQEISTLDGVECVFCYFTFFVSIGRLLHDELSSVHASVSDGPTFLNFLPIITRYSNQEALDVLAA
jgi:hypothetical protein